MPGTELILPDNFVNDTMTIIHFITDKYPPSTGGLEIRTKRIAHAIAAKGYQVIVHILDHRHDHSYYNENGSGVTITLPFKDNSLLHASVFKSKLPEYVMDWEMWRFYFLTLSNTLSESIRKHPGARHILLSNFITRVGYTTALIAERFKLQHIASVVGSDFSRGLVNPYERTIFDFVMKQATIVVTLNNEHADVLSQLYPGIKIKVIHSAVDQKVLDSKWVFRRQNHIRLFSDGGYSYKKGTEALLYAFGKLADEGLHVQLTICGSTIAGQEAYWKDQIEMYQAKYPDRLFCHGYLSQDDLLAFALDHHIFCSPTIGEGCSNSRLLALNIGMPIVTTACGEIPDVAATASHVYTCMPGDTEAYCQVLREAVNAILNQSMEIDPLSTSTWNSYFTADRETADWMAVIAGLSGD
jgi:glycosyltransferase involved in cell wall biosynthesis